MITLSCGKDETLLYGEGEGIIDQEGITIWNNQARYMSTEEKLGGGGGEYGESNIEPGEILERGVTSSDPSVI
jgi:hypothetical protein